MQSKAMHEMQTLQTKTPPPDPHRTGGGYNAKVSNE